jgi:thiamine biosynthesis lipoprotein
MADATAPVLLACHAMATRFELVLYGTDSVRLRAAGEAALAEIQRLEASLSLYQPTSDIARLNAHAARQPVRVSSEVFDLLKKARDLWRQTDGAFDVTVGALVRAWGFAGGCGAWPSPHLLAEARACVGMQWLELDEAQLTVRFSRPGVMIDLGGIGKGYALDCAAERLRESGVTCALLHGGTSTALALGHPPGAEAWKIAVEWKPHWPDQQSSPPAPQLTPPPVSRDAELWPQPQPLQSGAPVLLAVVPLQDEALSVSAIWGRAFQHQGRVYGHVLDPRTGQPVSDAGLAAVVLPSATDADALSTALLCAGRAGFEPWTRRWPTARALLAGCQSHEPWVWTLSHNLCLHPSTAAASERTVAGGAVMG